MPSAFLKTILSAIVASVAGSWISTIRSEFEVAKVETKVKLKEVGKGIALVAVAACLAFFTVLLLLASAVLALSNALDPWVAALIVAGAVLFWVLLLGLWGAYKIRKNKDLVPRRSIDKVKESFQG